MPSGASANRSQTANKPNYGDTNKCHTPTQEASKAATEVLSEKYRGNHVGRPSKMEYQQDFQEKMLEKGFSELTVADTRAMGVVAPQNGCTGVSSASRKAAVYQEISKTSKSSECQ